VKSRKFKKKKKFNKLLRGTLPEQGKLQRLLGESKAIQWT